MVIIIITIIKILKISQAFVSKVCFWSESRTCAAREFQSQRQSRRRG